MAKQANRMMIGGFVILAVLIMAASLVVFGSGKFFQKTNKYILYFDGSIMGLSVGAPVLFQGVPVGSVTSITLEADLVNMKSQIPIFIEIDPSHWKIRAGQRDYREVYHSLRNAGEWGIDLAKNWKIFRYHPGMFKIQVQHQGSSTGKNENDSSVDQLLGLIVREIDRHVAEKN